MNISLPPPAYSGKPAADYALSLIIDRENSPFRPHVALLYRNGDLIFQCNRVSRDNAEAEALAHAAWDHDQRSSQQGQSTPSVSIFDAY